MINANPLLRPPFWMPSNITEYLFCDENGNLTTSCELANALSYDFTSILKSAYNEIKKRYEGTLNAIIQDTEISQIDFPLIAPECEVPELSSLLPSELADKLGLKKKDEQEPQQSKNQEEEKQGGGEFQGLQKDWENLNINESTQEQSEAAVSSTVSG